MNDPKTAPLDPIDRGMIKLLQKDGRMPIVALSKTLGISETTARTRLNRLIKKDIIKVLAVSNPIKLGFDIFGSLKIEIDLKKKDTILEQLKKIDQLNYIVLTTGGTDIHAEFAARSLKEFQELIFEKICRIDGVNSSQTALIVDIVKDAWDYGTGWD